MYHFFTEPALINSELVTIIGQDVNHIRNVLRMKAGDKILVGNGADLDFVCEISELSEYSVKACILEVHKDTRELSSRIYLFQGLPKSDKMDLIIQKAVELGVYEVIPMAAKRSVVKLDPKKELLKGKRWAGISESAAKQSKRMRIPVVTNVLSFREAVAYAKDFDCNIIPYELARGIEDTRKVIKGMKPDTSIGVFIGPEGGFEESEIQTALNSGIIPVSLGRRILRTETAGLTALSLIMFQLEQ